MTSKPTNGIIEWITRHGVMPNLLMITLIIGGLVMSTQIKKEVFPEFELDMVTVTVPYPGASPEEIEQGILLVIEEAVRGLDGVKKITSRANDSSGTVSIELEDGENRQQRYQEVQEEVNRIRTFPEEAEKPKITLVSRKREVLQLQLYGDAPESVLREIAEQVRDRLLQSKEISLVELRGVRNPEISIEIKESTLRAYGLSLDAIAAKIRQIAMELPGGSLKTTEGDILLRMKGRLDWATQFSKVPVVTSADGSYLTLSDLGVVKEDFEDSKKEAMFNGKRAIGVGVYRVGSETPTGVADAVRASMKEIYPDLPDGVDFAIRKDRSKIYRQRLNLLLRNAGLGLILVFLCLSLFLEIRLAFWVTMGIPTSFLGALLFLPATGVTINMISMFAFIVTLGIVVDDAIVAGENVYEYRQKGLPFMEAAIEGAKDVAIPITFSILTNIFAFLPLLIIPGFIGKIWAVIPVIVISVFLISWVESLLILPAHLSHRPKHNKFALFVVAEFVQKRFAAFYTHLINHYYRRFIRICLRFRYLTLTCLVGIFIIVLAYAASGRMGFILMPKVESDHSDVTAVLPYGSPIHEARTVAERLVKTAQKVIESNGNGKLSEGIYTQINANQVEVSVYLTAPEMRPISTAQFTKLWRKETGDISGLQSIKFESDRGGPGRGASISVELSHRNIDVLDKASEKLAMELTNFPNVKDIDDGYAMGNPQFDFTLNEQGHKLGLTTREIANQLRGAFYGKEVLRQQRGRNEVKVIARYPRQDQSIVDIKDFQVRTSTGTFVPMNEVVNFVKGRAYTSIQRRDGRRVVTVTANVVPNRESNQVIAALKESVLPKLCEEFRGLTYSFEGRRADMRDALSVLKLGFVFALIGIYILLAIPFKSYFQPAIVMCSIPFGIVGAILGHIMMGYSISMISLFGILALAGVVVNDSLIMVDYANKVRATGLKALQAVEDAGVRRFRPIILTTITTFGGLAPMIFETSRQARFLIPMAISLGYGILFATFITLILVPCLYMVVEDIKSCFGIHHQPGISDMEAE
jgi:multidrug efflux pump subunit AcrB